MVINKKGVGFALTGSSLILILLIGGFAFFGLREEGFLRQPLGITVPGTGATVTGTDISIGGVCAIEDISMKLISERAGKRGTIPNEEWFLEVDGISLGLNLAEASSNTVAVNQDFRLVHAWNQSDLDTAYYSTELFDNTNCKDPFRVLVRAPQIETSFSSSFITDSDNSLNADAAFVIGAEEQHEITYTFKCSSDQFFGNPNTGGKNMIIIEYNTTVFTDVDWKVQGESTASVPSWFPNAAAGLRYRAFTLPKCGAVGSSDQKSISIELKSDTTDPSASDDVRFHLIDTSTDLDQDDFSTIIGFEDESGNQISRGNQTIVWDVS